MKSKNNQPYLLATRGIIGNQIAFKRKELKLTQQDLASACNTSRTTISKIERGEWSISIDFLTMIGLVLGFTVEIHFPNTEQDIERKKLMFDFKLGNRFPTKEEWLQHQLELGHITMETYLRETQKMTSKDAIWPEE